MDIRINTTLAVAFCVAGFSGYSIRSHFITNKEKTIRYQQESSSNIALISRGSPILNNSKTIDTSAAEVHLMESMKRLEKKLQENKTTIPSDIDLNSIFSSLNEAIVTEKTKSSDILSEDSNTLIESIVDELPSDKEYTAIETKLNELKPVNNTLNLLGEDSSNIKKLLKIIKQSEDGYIAFRKTINSLKAKQLKSEE